MRRLATALSVLALEACATSVTYRQDLATICDSPAHATAGETGLAAVGPYLDEHVKTPEGRARVAELKDGGASRLKADATANGLASCPLVDPKP